RPIPDEMLEKFPLLKKQIESSEVCEAVRVHFGGNYILPKPDCTDPTVYLGERKGIFIRKDWLKKVGLEIPTTWDAFYEVCKAFTLNDPDGNGVNDTYGLTGDSIGNLRYFFSSLGHSNMNWVKQADGTWTHGALMEDNIQLLELLRKMYAEGLIDPEIGSTKWEQAMQKFASNTFGMVIRNADADWINNVLTKNYWEANKDKGNPYDIIGLIPALSIKKEDKPSMDAYIDCMCATMVNADLSDESLERYLEFHEWCMAGEGELMRLGFENVDWKYDEAGKIVKLLDEKGNPINLAEKYPCIAVTYMPTWGFRLMADPNIQTYDNFNDECKALNAEACAVRNANIVKSDMRVKLISAQSMLDANAFKFTVEYWNIVSGTEPVADMFHAMVDRAMQDGFAQAIEDVNAICKEKGW
ncbi:MAG: extracellular solute-binding protein, partial [Clostridia bacterium]